MIFELNVPHIWKKIFDQLRTYELCNLCKADYRFIPIVEEYFFCITKGEKELVSRHVASLSENKFKSMEFYCKFHDWRMGPSFAELKREWDSNWNVFQELEDYLYPAEKKFNSSIAPRVAWKKGEFDFTKQGSKGRMTEKHHTRWVQKGRLLEQTRYSLFQRYPRNNVGKK
jgi:hypothetical protein